MLQLCVVYVDNKLAYESYGVNKNKSYFQQKKKSKNDNHNDKSRRFSLCLFRANTVSINVDNDKTIVKY